MTPEDLLKQIFSAGEDCQYATALELCLIFEREFPDHLAVRMAHAEALTNLNRFGEATAILLEAYSHNEATAFSKYHCQCLLGHAFEEMGRFDDARSAYEIALRLRPNKTPLIYLGALELGCGNFATAREWLNQALEYKGENLDEAYFNLGSSYLAEGDYLRAIESYRKAIEADPDYKIAKDFLEDAKNALKIQNESNER